jgi:transcriptional regulator with XRE-family HTH domain
MNGENPYQLQTPREVSLLLAGKVRQLRLQRKWKQATLAERSGVSLASLRRFERTGLVSLQSLLKLSFTLGRLSDFDSILNPPKAASIRELEALAAGSTVKRGSK